MASALMLGACASAPVVAPDRGELPVSLTGTGRTPSQGPFNLTAGTRTFSLTHSGRSNFVMRLLRSDKSVDGQLINTNGSYHGNTPYQVRRSGQYYVEVQADGAWTLSVN
jgi:hypothetical protein